MKTALKFMHTKFHLSRLCIENSVYYWLIQLNRTGNIEKGKQNIAVINLKSPSGSNGARHHPGEFVGRGP